MPCRVERNITYMRGHMCYIFFPPFTVYISSTKLKILTERKNYFRDFSQSSRVLMENTRAPIRIPSDCVRNIGHRRTLEKNINIE